MNTEDKLKEILSEMRSKKLDSSIHKKINEFIDLYIFKGYPHTFTMVLYEYKKDSSRFTNRWMVIENEKINILAAEFDYLGIVLDDRS